MEEHLVCEGGICRIRSEEDIKEPEPVQPPEDELSREAEKLYLNSSSSDDSDSDDSVSDEVLALIDRIMNHVVEALGTRTKFNTPLVSVTILHHLLLRHGTRLRFRPMRGFLNIWGPIAEKKTGHENPEEVDFFSEELLKEGKVKTIEHWWIDWEGTILDPYILVSFMKEDFALSFRQSYTREPIAKIESEYPSEIAKAISETRPGEALPFECFTEDVGEFIRETLSRFEQREVEDKE